MKTWDGLNAEEIASIPRDEYCFQKIERILRERNELRELSDEEILEYSDVFSLDKSPLYEFTDKGLVLFTRAILERHGIK